MVFGAAATLLQMALDIAIAIARWIALRVFAFALIATVLPWVLRGVFVWVFEYIEKYGLHIVNYLMTTIGNQTQGNLDVNLNMTGIGGYLANQTGLIDYCSILATNWALIVSISFLIRVALRTRM